MYVVKYKNRVVLGIIPWNSKYISDVFRVRYRENIEIPVEEPQESSFPFNINDEIIVYKAEEKRDLNINPLIEYYYGPTWEFVNDKAIATYEIRPLQLLDVKNNYKTIAANLRYAKEIEGTKIVINDNEFSLETDRESRKKYIEKLITMTSTSINWKFKEGWATLTKVDLQRICNTLEDHVQSAFEDEYNLCNLIDQATTVDDILSIEQLNSKLI